MERAGSEREGAGHGAKARLEWAMLAAILAAAALLVPEALRTRLWVAGLPGPGLYPIILLGLIAAVSGVLVASSLLSRRGAGEAERQPEAAGGAGRLLPVGVGLSLLLFPLTMPLFGFRAVAFAYALVLALVLSPARYVRRIATTVVFAALLAAGLHFLFARIFNVVLPIGSLTGF